MKDKALDKLRPDERPEIVNLLAPDGAKNKACSSKIASDALMQRLSTRKKLSNN